MFFLLLATLSLLLHGVYLPKQTLFSNDGPLGRIMSQCHQLPDRFTGCWDDLNGIGLNGGIAAPSITFGLMLLLKPVLFSKIYVLVALMILGLGVWWFFAQLRLAPVACILGGLAAALNSYFFSDACWGLAAHAISVGLIFVALALLLDTSSRQRWLRVALAGLAVGINVMESADIGAIFSLFVVTFMIYQTWISGGSRTRRFCTGLGRLMLVTACAGVIAAQTVTTLVGTNINGVVGAQQDTSTKEAHWDWATQWSLPLQETTGLIVPGLFGYRMDAPDGGCYWGEVGRDPAVERYIENGGQHGPPPAGFIRYNGGGIYAGVLVVMLVVFAVIQTLRRKDSIFNTSQKQWIYFGWRSPSSRCCCHMVVSHHFTS